MRTVTRKSRQGTVLDDLPEEVREALLRLAAARAEAAAAMRALSAAAVHCPGIKASELETLTHKLGATV